MTLFSKIRSLFAPSGRDGGSNSAAPATSATSATSASSVGRTASLRASDKSGSRPGAKPDTKSGGLESSFLVFQQTGEVIQAERVLREAGFEVEVKGPPPELRSGCDMVLVFKLMLELPVRTLLESKGLSPLRVVPVRDTLLEPVSLFQVKDYGKWFMVRAANMKITVEKETGTIVNISGGGCPDVPYLAALLSGRRIDEAEEPRTQGRTLCAYALQRAFEEAGRQWP